jgi:hypothetical protein
LPVLAHAQEATLSGTVTDTTGATLPGVTVRAVHEASGNTFEVVTDSRGDYRLPLRIGTYQLTADLAGFGRATRLLTLLVGQQAVVNLQMAVSGVEEKLTVTAQAPLLDVTGSSLGGNIDSRQMADLPINGRNWMDLTMLSPGARLNAVGEVPHSVGAGELRNQGDFNLNVDGQQITWQGSYSAGDGQPRFSRDAIAEFEFLSSRFDATQGRSSGVQINVITKSGTNTPSGSFSGYFRDDSWTAADFVAKRVLPYQDQQLSGTFGGPIRKDRLHFFANYEYERQPVTYSYSTPFPLFNADITDTNVDKKGFVKLDAQFSPQTRLSGRGSWFNFVHPTGRLGGESIGTSTPSFNRGNVRDTEQFSLTLTQVLSNRLVNEIKGGYSGYRQNTTVLAQSGYRGTPGLGGPFIIFAGLLAGGPPLFPEIQSQYVWNVRDDFTSSFTKGGRHTLKTGAEYLHFKVIDVRCSPCEGWLEAFNGPVPVGQLSTIFPDPIEPSTWNLAPLSPISVRWRQAFGATGSPIIRNAVPRHTVALWAQDDWNVLPRLTLNLGVRYDLELNAFANNVDPGILAEFLPNRPNDTNNVAPRLGATFTLNNRTVLRGGFGVYFGTVADDHYTYYWGHSISLAVENDGRPDFASNPWNGPEPTFASILPRLCTPALQPGCLRPEAVGVFARLYQPDYQMPHSYQASAGLQRQVGDTMAIEADYVYVGSRNQPWAQPNQNLSYDPVTGANYPFTDISKRPFPHWGGLSMTTKGMRFNSHALQTAFTKRLSQGWQASGTYTLSGLWDAYPPPYSGLQPVSFPVAPDLGGEYGLAAGDQRHRASVNGIWQLPYGLQLSGLYFFGSGERRPTFWGVDLRQMGSSSGERRLRPDGTIVPRNNFVGDPLHRVDLRLQRRFRLGGPAVIEGIVELFNVFNHANYGTYVTDEASSNYGKPVSNLTAAYLPRMLQLGFRFVF